MTWSCYRDEEPACGTCDACAFRLEAFRNAGSRDPIAYAEGRSFRDLPVTKGLVFRGKYIYSSTDTG